MKRNILSDADAARTSQLAARRRAHTTVGAATRQQQMEEAWEDHATATTVLADLVARYRAAGGDKVAELGVAAEAARFDKQHGIQPPMLTRLLRAVDDYEAVA